MILWILPVFFCQAKNDISCKIVASYGSKFYLTKVLTSLYNIIATKMYKKDAKIESLPTTNGGHMSAVGH